MSETDNYRLTRPDHQTSLAGCIQEETEFRDVSLACEDQQVRAHKVVLAASSPKLRNILLSQPHPQPLIYLTGVRFSILEKILKFIYTGQVDIRSDQLDSLLAVARDLQVKELGGPPVGAQTGGEVSTTSRNTERSNVERSAAPREDQESPTVKKQPVTQEFVEGEGEDNNSLARCLFTTTIICQDQLRRRRRC